MLTNSNSFYFILLLIVYTQNPLLITDITHIITFHIPAAQVYVTCTLFIN